MLCYRPSVEKNYSVTMKIQLHYNLSTAMVHQRMLTFFFCSDYYLIRWSDNTICRAFLPIENLLELIQQLYQQYALCIHKHLTMASSTPHPQTPLTVLLSLPHPPPSIISKDQYCIYTAEMNPKLECLGRLWSLFGMQH